MCSWAFLGSQPYFDWRYTWEKQISENDSATIPNAPALGRKNAEHEVTHFLEKFFLVVTVKQYRVCSLYILHYFPIDCVGRGL